MLEDLQIKYPKISRRSESEKDTIHAFEYGGMVFSQESFHIFAGLNAVDNKQNVAKTFAGLQKNGLSCARMGAFKPRTSPYSFQGLGVECLEYVFQLAAEHGIKIIAMEITHESQLDAVHNVLQQQNNPTKLLVQIGTRNAQNFELLKAIGSQNEFAILYKRGYGISLEESIAACEYLAHAGNEKIIFCLRGMKSQYAAPHRNFVDFAHVPVIRRLTKMPVCVDPSHAVGNYEKDLLDIPDIFNVSAQGIVAGANMLLVDIHPLPTTALVDAKQAIPLEQLEWYLEDVRLCRELYKRRIALHQHQIMQKVCNELFET